jgi:hypothetical protein
LQNNRTRGESPFITGGHNIMMEKRVFEHNTVFPQETLDMLLASLPRDLKIAKIMEKMECDYYKAVEILNKEENLENQ